MSRSSLTHVLCFLLTIILGIGLVGCASSQSASSDDDEEEEETVAVAYGEQKKQNVTTATSTITPDEQDQSSASDFSDLLQGRTAGVRVQKNPSGIKITIRGINSFNLDTSPLYVIDGMAVEPNPNGTIPVHPQTVKSITVLKDAGATAMYGSRGANGVIVIKTKQQ